MQQTETYKLNLIEKDDVFSPDALNQNTQRVESVLHTFLTGEEAAREDADKALSDRITALELKRVVIGTYVGQSSDYNVWQEIDLGFAPIAILFRHRTGGVEFAVKDIPSQGSQPQGVFQFTESGFRVSNTLSYFLNNKDSVYCFVAFM